MAHLAVNYNQSLYLVHKRQETTINRFIWYTKDETFLFSSSNFIQI